MRRVFFTPSAVFAWNTLPAVVGEGDMIATFKKCLDRYMDLQGIEAYGIICKLLKVSFDIINFLFGFDPAVDFSAIIF